MPRYLYVCDECDKEREVSLMVVERDKLEGDRCAFTLNCGGRLHRVLTGTTFVLGKKGKHGWADTGYADNTVGNQDWFKKQEHMGLK